MLPVNDTMVFYSPLCDEIVDADDNEMVLVRTGTIGDGSCFYHSMLHACSSEYRRSSSEVRKKIVKKVRQELSSCLSFEDWVNLGVVAKLSFEEEVNRIVTKKYRNQDNSDSCLEMLKEICPIDWLEKTLFPKVFETESGFWDRAKLKVIIGETIGSLSEVNKLKKSKIEKICSLMINKIESIFLKAEEDAYERYVKELKNTEEEVDQKMIGLLSDKFDRDVYFIDAKTRLPYNGASSKENIKGRYSVLILWIDSCHYEILGELSVDSQGRKKISREFDRNHPLIKKVKMYLTDSSEYEDIYGDVRSREKPNTTLVDKRSFHGRRDTNKTVGSFF